VINVGDASALCNLCDEQDELVVTEKEFSGSLFRALKDEASTINNAAWQGERRWMMSLNNGSPQCRRGLRRRMSEWPPEKRHRQCRNR
jgi:hypothetical protein